MQKPRIMIVDDSKFSVALIKRILNNHGFDVVAEAMNKEEMIRGFTKHKPDFITMDLTMPDADGFESIALLRKIDPNFKSVMISSLKDHELERTAKSLKINAYIQKPINEKELIKVINNVLNVDMHYLELIHEHSAVFYESFADSVQQMTRTNVSFQSISEEEVSSSRGVVVALGIIGTFPGRFFIDMDNDTLSKFAASIADQELQEMDEKIGFISEFANIVAGNACSMLNAYDRGYKLRLSSPTVFYGKDFTISTSNLKTYLTVAKTAFGDITIGTSFSRGDQSW